MVRDPVIPPPPFYGSCNQIEPETGNKQLWVLQLQAKNLLKGVISAEPATLPLSPMVKNLKLHINLLYDPVIFLLGIYLRGKK